MGKKAVNAVPMALGSMRKKTDVQISIRKNNPSGYVINVYRPGTSKYGPSVSEEVYVGRTIEEEVYVGRTIEEVETITSSLLRSGRVPKELGGS